MSTFRKEFPGVDLPVNHFTSEYAASFGFEDNEEWRDFAFRDVAVHLARYSDVSLIPADQIRQQIETWSENEVANRLAAGDISIPATPSERRQELLRLMSEFNETENENDYAFPKGFEIRLWSFLEGDNRPNTAGMTKEWWNDRIEEIRRLRDALGEWPKPLNGETGEWLTVAEFQPIYMSYKEDRDAGERNAFRNHTNYDTAMEHISSKAPAMKTF